MSKSGQERTPEPPETKDPGEMTSMEPAQAALEHDRDAPVGPDRLPSLEEKASATAPPKQRPRRAYLDVTSATEEDIEAFVRHLRGDDDG